MWNDKGALKMKLSMWMLANRLSSLDLVLNIADDAKPILKSARRVYATNCFHVYQEGHDVICNGEGDTIRIKDMPVTEAFELVQYVFDFYEDWYSEVVELIKSGNYPEAVKSGMQRLDFKGDLCYPGITYSLYFNEILCGRINVLEKDRPLNPGDFQLLELLADILKVYLAEQSKTSRQGTNMDFFHLLLTGVHVDDEQLELLLSYPRWKKGRSLPDLYCTDDFSESGERPDEYIVPHHRAADAAMCNYTKISKHHRPLQSLTLSGTAASGYSDKIGRQC